MSEATSKSDSSKKEYPGKRILYDLRRELSLQGSEICGYMRLQHLEDDKINGYCSLCFKNCSYEIPNKTPTEDCLIYQDWLKERKRNKKSKTK